MKILLACERSGGHIFPALVVGKRLRAKYGAGAKIDFFITSDSFRSSVTKEGFDVFGKSFKKRHILIEMPWRFFESLYLLLRLRPGVVMGFGGRDTIFLVLFAGILGAKTYIYDPNVVMGKANRMLLPFVKKVFTGFYSGGKASARGSGRKI